MSRPFWFSDASAGKGLRSQEGLRSSDARSKYVRTSPQTGSARWAATRPGSESSKQSACAWTGKGASAGSPSTKMDSVHFVSGKSSRPPRPPRSRAAKNADEPEGARAVSSGRDAGPLSERRAGPSRAEFPAAPEKLMALCVYRQLGKLLMLTQPGLYPAIQIELRRLQLHLKQ